MVQKYICGARASERLMETGVRQDELFKGTVLETDTSKTVNAACVGSLATWLSLSICEDAL
jgi:hypothetical protein